MAGVAVTLMHRARWDHATAERREHLMTLLTDRISAALDLAAAGGELADEPAEPALVAAMLLGPILFRRLMQDQPVSPELIEQALDSAVTWRLTGDGLRRASGDVMRQHGPTTAA